MKGSAVATREGSAPRRRGRIRTRPSQRIKRVAFNVSETMDKNVELYALKRGLQKNQVFVEALDKLLRADSMEPDREPIVSVSYR